VAVIYFLTPILNLYDVKDLKSILYSESSSKLGSARVEISADAVVDDYDFNSIKPP
jgi:hypothetical protein